jgi:hypothetical protein
MNNMNELVALVKQVTAPPKRRKTPAELKELIKAITRPRTVLELEK